MNETPEIAFNAFPGTVRLDFNPDVRVIFKNFF